MKFTPLLLEGAYEIDLKFMEDERGFFARMYCDEEFANHQLNISWAQMNLSLNRNSGTIRGLHFQRAPAADIKLVRCVRGAVRDIIVDMRGISKTFGQYCNVELNADRRNAIYIPRGFAHGFQTLEDDTELQYFHSCAYTPAYEGGINPFDPGLGIDWDPEVSSISDRDRNLPMLAECAPL